jgi:hypothetical protein
MRVAVILILMSAPAFAGCPCGSSLNASGVCVADPGNVCPAAITRQMLQNRANVIVNGNKAPAVKKPEIDQTKAAQ